MSRPIPNPGIMDIAPYVGGKSVIPGLGAGAGKRVIKLSSNESPLGASPLAVEAYRAHAGTLHRYPDGNSLAVREAIAEVHGLEVSQLVCGAGSDELIQFLVNAYVGAGDEVLFSEHGFLMYKLYSQAAGAVPVAAPEKGLRTDVDALLSRVSKRTKVVFVANPNNPTGSYLPASEMARLRKGLPEDVVLAVDGAYAEYVTAQDYTDGRELVDAGENTVMLRTFSKLYGLPSLRLGWGYMPRSIADVLNRVRGPFNVSGAAIAAGVAAVRDVAFAQKAVEHNVRWLAWLAGELTKLGLKVHPSVGNFLLVDFLAGKAQAANAYLLEEGIIVREVGNYGLPNSLRITVGTEEENMALISALSTFLRA